MMDTTTQTIKRLTHSGPGMLGYLKALVEERARQAETTVPSSNISYGYGQNWQPPDPAKPNW